jgi:hypothetical protein
MGIVENIDDFGADEDSYSTHFVRKPNVTLSVERNIGKQFSYGFSASMIQQSKFVEFDYPRLDEIEIAASFSDLIRQRHLSLNALGSKKFCEFACQLSVGVMQELDFKSRHESENFEQAFIVQSFMVSNGEFIQRIDGFGVRRPEVKRSFTTLVASLRFERNLVAGLTGGVQFLYRRFPPTMIEFRRYSSEWGPPPTTTVSISEFETDLIRVKQDNLECRISLTYNLSTLWQKKDTLSKE